MLVTASLSSGENEILEAVILFLRQRPLSCMLLPWSDVLLLIANMVLRISLIMWPLRGKAVQL